MPKFSQGNPLKAEIWLELFVALNYLKMKQMRLAVNETSLSNKRQRISLIPFLGKLIVLSGI